MCHFESTKHRFLFCLGISFTLCSLIYLSNDISLDPKPLEAASCRPFSSACKAYLPGATNGVQWQRRDCQVESYILNGQLQCSEVAKDLHFITRPLSHEELEYPLAFIMTVHKELEIFVRVLRAIYMPQNVYCIHVDAKAPMEYQVAVRMLVSCFENIFVSSQRETVTYGGFSRLQADLHCMKDLVKSKVGWKKVINLCGQDFPIKSNLELVHYMKSKEWRDTNLTPGVKQPPTMKYRTQFQHREIMGSFVNKLSLKKDPPPHNLELYFGTAYYALTRPFIDFVLTNPIALELLEWSKDTYSPDEHYWVTLNHIKEAPGNNIEGGWAGNVRAVKWSDQEGTAHDGCKGYYVRGICVFGIEDLTWIIKKNSMFANKFAMDKFPDALDCLEQWHRNKVLRTTTVPIEPSWLLARPNSSSSNFFDISTEA